MYYYITPQIGSGTDIDPYRPDLDAGSDFVGEIGSDGNYIIATTVQQSVKAGRTLIPPVTSLQDACNTRGINYNDVINKWSVS